MMRLSIILITFILLTACELQAVNNLSYIEGILIDSETKEPVDNAEIFLPDFNYKVYSDSLGKFILKSIKPGVYQLEIRRIGYKNQIKQCHIEKSDSVKKTFFIEPYKITTQTIHISSKRYNSGFTEITNETSVLEGRELNNDLGQSLAATIKNEISIAVQSLGPAPARPVIRGMTGNRITIADDGISTNDLSSTSPDHAVTIEPFSAERIEIVRGPRAVLFTTSLSGGVVNVVNEKIPMNQKMDDLWTAGLFYESANNALLGAVSMEMPLSKVNIKSNFLYKKAGNIRSPNKILENTNIENYNYNLGLSYSLKDFVIGVSSNEFNINYGIPGGFIGGHPNGVDIDMVRRNYECSILYHLHNPWFDNVHAHFIRSYYHHSEFESNSVIAAEYVFRNIASNILVNQKPYAIFDNIILNGTYGLFFSFRDSKVGGYVFTAPTQAYSIAPYFFEEVTVNDLTIQTGFRLAFDYYTPQLISTITDTAGIYSKHFQTYSFSFLIMKEMVSKTFMGISFNKSGRPPSVEELFNQGPHLASYSYETGNPFLEEERGMGAEIFFNFKNEFTSFLFTTFFNRFDYYIIHQNTGKINYQLLLPIYQAKGIVADVYGFESMFKFNLSNFTSEITLGYVIGENITAKTNLPSIPPFKGNILFSYKYYEHILGFKSEFAFNQNRTDVFEESTKGYIVYGLFANFNFSFMKTFNVLSINLENITNATYRNHLSRIKSILPEPARSIKISYKVYY